MQDKLEKLIEEGNAFSFKNNSNRVSHGCYTMASDKLLSWIANVDDFIRDNYGDQSGPFRLFERFNSRYLNGYVESDFETQMAILRGSLLACRQLKPKPRRRFNDESLIIALLKNTVFWTVVVVAVASSFTLGLYFGSTRFDQGKNELYEQNKQMKDELLRIKKQNNKGK